MSAYRPSDSRHSTLAAALAGGVQTMILIALIIGLRGGAFIPAQSDPAFAVITIKPPPAPPPPAVRHSGGSSAPRANALPGPSAAPLAVAVPVIPPQPLPSATGSLGDAGTVGGGGNDWNGPGDGNGAGDGPGRGDSAGGSDAHWLRGEITERDYPRAAWKSGQGGHVGLRFTVATDGRVSACHITRSSGSQLLDDTTCRLIMKRFRYAPARDATGRAVVDEVIGEHEWVVAGKPDNPSTQGP